MASASGNSSFAHRAAIAPTAREGSVVVPYIHIHIYIYKWRQIFLHIYVYMFMWVRYTRVFVRGSFSLSYTSINVRICLHMYGFIPTYTEPAVCRSSLPGYISASNFNGDNPYICVCSVYVRSDVAAAPTFRAPAFNTFSLHQSLPCKLYFV